MKKKYDLSDHKLIKKLSLLDSVEHKSFQRWLVSPWCNSRKILAKLHKYLMKYSQSADHEKMQLDRLYKKLYPDKPYHHKSMLNMLSDLSIEVERFLMHEMLKDQGDVQRELLKKVFQQKHRPEEELDVLQKEAGQLTLKADLMEEDYLQLACTEEQIYWLMAAQRRGLPDITHLQRAQDSLDQFYIHAKLRMLTEQVESARVSGMPKDVSRSLKLLGELIGEPKAPAARWYFDFLQVQENMPLPVFKALKAQFVRILPQIEARDKTIMLLLLINETARKKLSGEKNVMTESLELYDLGLSENILLYKGEMTPRTFANIISVANGLKRFDYVDDFLDKYIGYLKADLQETARLWALTYSAYLSGKPELKTLVRKLNRQSMIYTTFSLRSRVLVTQIRFDEYWLDQEAIEDTFWKYNDAFTQKLRREKDYSPKHIQALKTFNDYVRKLAEMLPITSHNRDAFYRLKKAFEREDAIHAKTWLEDRLEKIGGK